MKFAIGALFVAVLFAASSAQATTTISFDEPLSAPSYPHPLASFSKQAFSINGINFFSGDYTAIGVGGSSLGIGTEGYGVVLTASDIGLGLSNLSFGARSDDTRQIVIEFFAAGNFSYLQNPFVLSGKADHAETITLSGGSWTALQFDFRDAQAIRIGATMATFRVDTLSLDVAAIPEPASWAMMIAGFGVLGGALRRRHRLNTRSIVLLAS